MRLLIAVTVAMAASPIGAAELTSEQLDILTRELNDPASAQLRALTIPAETPEAICGEINWKGVEGGYVGFKKFWLAAGHAAIEGDDLFLSGAGVLGCPT